MRMINKILLSLIAVLCLDATVTAQNKQVSGTVTDPAGAPVVGATVLVEGTTIGSTTDASGHFSLNAPEDAKLNISFIGYESQQVDVAGRTHIPVSLKEDSHTIDDVVVTAMGTDRIHGRRLGNQQYKSGIPPVTPHSLTTMLPSLPPILYMHYRFPVLNCSKAPWGLSV